MTIDLSDKKILVTGASRGIGKGISEQLSAAGAELALHYNSNKAEAKKLQQQLAAPSEIFQADLSDSKAAGSLFDAVIQKMNRIDVIINNAGVAIGSDFQQADDLWLNDWEKTISVNLIATGILCKKAIEHFTSRTRGGIIINISSRAAFRGDTADYMAYAASKGGVVALTKSIARAFGKQNVIAFDVAPGFTKTDMAQDFINQYGEEYVKSDIALNELTEPKHIAPLIAFLSSGLANHLTGTTIDVNAGSYVH